MKHDVFADPWGGNVDVMAELNDLQSRLAALANAVAAAGCVQLQKGTWTAQARVRQIQRLRKSRDHLFHPDLFADPAWDMLLELYAAELDCTRLSVSSLCLASTSPPTTALRWLNKLEEQGWVSREPDLHDARRVFVFLSEKGSKAMRTFIAQYD